jgi:predicted kinase
MLDGGKYSKDNEATVKSVEIQLAASCILGGFNVIIDDTNLHPESMKMWERFEAAFSSVLMEIKDFTDVPLSTCIERDRQRSKPVGEQVIRDMYDTYLRENNL